MPEVMGLEVSQVQFDEASRLFDKIEKLKQEQREAGSLQDKLNIRFKINRLIQQRYEVLGI